MNYLLRNSLRRINSLSLISSSSFTTITSLKSSSSLLLKNKSNLSSIRSLSLGKGYDVLGDVDEENPRTNINAYGKKSFSVTNVYVTHSVALFPRSFLLWNARKPSDITMESLDIFANYYPTIEILFIGTGKKKVDIPDAIHKRFRELGTILDVTDTATAAATFNLLNSEGRNVCAALLTMEVMEDDDFQLLVEDDLDLLNKKTNNKK